MKKSLLILFSILLVAGCKKDAAVPREGTTLPFENENLKLELITSSLPLFVRDVHFFDEANGIIVTYDSKIFGTSDKGKTWELKFANSDSRQALLQVQFISASTGYALGGGDFAQYGDVPPGGLLLKTTDGGNTWTKIYSNRRVLYSLASNSTGELYTILNGISKSADNGISWTTVDSSYYRSGTIIFDGNHGFYTGWFGKMFRTCDDGKTWQRINRQDSGQVNYITFLNNTLYYINNNKTVFKSGDYGDTWTMVFDSDRISYVVNPLTEQNCLIFGAGNYSGGCIGIWSSAIRQTTNSGASWTETELNDIGPINWTSFYSSTEGYGTDGSGHLIKVTVKSKK